MGKFEELREAAKNTIGHHYDYNDILIASSLQIIQYLNIQIDRIENEMTRQDFDPSKLY